jgi:lipopolysaccharide export system permease protein
MSFLVGTLTAFSRLSSDSEVTAMKASRISLYSMTRPVILFALVSFLITSLSSSSHPRPTTCLQDTAV